MTMSSSTSSLEASLEIIEVKPGLKFSKQVLIDLLPDVETALFFGKVYGLDYVQLSTLLSVVLKSDVATALFTGDHSTDLQDYLIEGYYDEDGDWYEALVPAAKRGNVTFDPDVPKGEILPEVWKSLEVDVASSLKEVAEKLHDTLGLLPGKQGQMVFKSMAMMNLKRPIIGDFKARIHHAPQKQNLVIFDVSGSMSQTTVETIVDDVVALSYMANAHLAIVSNTTVYWAPGTYSVDDVLAKAQYGGTHYETLVDLLDQDWGVVITIADYDSSLSAKRHCAKAGGHIDQLLDISLVNRPTFLAECVGQVADEVRPLLVAQDYLC